MLSEPAVATEWLYRPQFTLAISIVILTAAALEIRNTSRSAIVLTTAIGASALASASVLIFSSAALGLVGVLRLACLRGRERLTLTSSLMVGGLLVALAGGPVSDALFGRGGSAGMVRIAFEPNWTDLVPFSIEGQAFVRLGIVFLLAISAIAAYQRRSWGLWYLVAAGFFGIAESIFVQSPIPSNDGRVIHVATAVAGVAAISGVASLSGSLRNGRRIAATLTFVLFIVLPTVVPRAAAGVRLASDEIFGRQSIVADSEFPFIGRTLFRQELFRKELVENWDFYLWLSDFLPNDARLLTTHPAVVASAAGVASPTSGLSLQVLSPRVAPVYEDALRYLYRDDLADMRITHIHVTESWENTLSSEARSLLANPAHFRLLADVRSISGRRDRIFEVVPGAGTMQVNPTSFRALRKSVKADQPFTILDGLTPFQRQMLLYTLVDHRGLRAPPTLFGRSTRLPSFNPVVDIPAIGAVALSEEIDPLMLGLSGADAIWTGYGIRVYDLASAWSEAWRVSVDFPAPIERFRVLCERSSSGELIVKLLGESGGEILLGTSSIRLTGRAQTSRISVRECKTMRLSQESGVKPYAQVRARNHDSGTKPFVADASLGFDGEYDGDVIVFNVSYWNRDKVPYEGSTEFRLYEIGPIGVTPASPSPRDSKRWWPGSVVLSDDFQRARVKFDPERLQLNGKYGGGVAKQVINGRTYLITLNVAVVGTESGLVEIQQQIPLARFEAGNEGSMPEMFSGVLKVRRPLQSSGLAHEYSSKLGFEIDRTPGFEIRDQVR